MRRILTSLALLAVGLAASPAAAGDVGGDTYEHSGPDSIERIAVIIELADSGSTGDGLALSQAIDLDQHGIEVTGVIDRLGLVAADVTPAGLAALERSGLVESVRAARRFRVMLDSSTATVEATSLHAAGRTGAGKVVVIIDSGVDVDHPGLIGSIVGEACFLEGAAGADEVCPDGSIRQIGPGAAEPCISLPESCTHGTHVAGVVSGDDEILSGVAPDAGILALRVFAIEAGEPLIPELGVLEALDYVYEMRDVHDIASVNLSLGADPLDCIDAAWEDVIARLTDAGIAVVAASGNDGFTTSISFPACLDDVVSVGATGDDGTVAGFTSSSTLLDLLAPGKAIDSTVLTAFDPSGFAEFNGTSFASPHVAAAFALVHGSQPEFTVDRMRDLMRATGEMVTRTTANPFDHDPRFPELRLAAVVDFEPFIDADFGFWVAASDWARHTGVSTGIGGGKFSPDNQLTRAEAVTFLWRFMGEPAASPNGFSDVPAGAWFTAAVDWAAETGVTMGLSPGIFGPGQLVSRAQVAAFMWRTAGTPPPVGSAGFVDVVGGSFYEDAVAWMAENGITTGTTPTTFSPDAVVTRAQMVTFEHRLADADNAWFGSVDPPVLALF